MRTATRCTLTQSSLFLCRLHGAGFLVLSRLSSTLSRRFERLRSVWFHPRIPFSLKKSRMRPLNPYLRAHLTLMLREAYKPKDLVVAPDSVYMSPLPYSCFPLYRYYWSFGPSCSLFTLRSPYIQSSCLNVNPLVRFPCLHQLDLWPACYKIPYSASFLTSTRVTKASPGGCKDPVPVKVPRIVASRFSLVQSSWVLTGLSDS